MKRFLPIAAVAAILFAVSTWVFPQGANSPFTPTSANRVTRAAGAPASGTCASANDVGKVYARSDAATTHATLYACGNTGASTYAWELGANGGGASIPAVTNFIKGDGAGNGADSGISPTNGIDYANLALDVMQYASVSVTSAQLKNLVAAPVQLVAAPGANKFIEVVSLVVIYNYGTATYTGGDSNFGVFYGSASGAQLVDFNVVGNLNGNPFGNTASKLQQFVLVGAAGSVASGNVQVPSAVINQAIVLAAPTTNLATGDGTAIFHIIYRVQASNA